MNSVNLLLFETFLSLGLSLLVIFLVSKPLKNILSDLCATESQAVFWRAYTHIMLLILPLMLVLLASILGKTYSDVDAIKISLLAALCGLILGMLIIGKRLFDPALKQNGCEQSHEK